MPPTGPRFALLRIRNRDGQCDGPVTCTFAVQRESPREEVIEVKIAILTPSAECDTFATAAAKARQLCGRCLNALISLGWIVNPAAALARTRT